MKKLPLIFALLALSGAAHADGSQPIFCSIPATTITAGTTSTRIALPAPAQACPVITITNGGTVAVYCSTGDSTVTAGPAGAMRTIQPQTPGVFTARRGDTYIACSTSTGTAGVTVEQSDAQPNLARAPGSGGGGGAVNSVSGSGAVSSTGGANPVIGLSSAAANTIIAGPVSGPAAAPFARPLVGGDLPVATASAVGAVKPGTGLAIAADGTLSASGGGGSTVQVNGVTVANPNFANSTSQTNAVKFSNSGGTVTAGLSELTNITGASLNLTDTSAVANAVTLDAPTTLNASYSVTLPPGQCASGQLWRFVDGLGTMGCASAGGTGTVTSVDGSGGTTGLTVSGGPITGNGTLTLGGMLAVNSGGTGTGTPSLVAGSNVTISGSWPNQTIAATAGAAGVSSVSLNGGTPQTGAVSITQTQADWNASSGVAAILNKPTIPAGQINSDWNATSGLAQILNKPTIPAAVSLAATGEPALTGSILLAAGPGVTLAQSGNTITISSTGGGGGSVTTSATWASGGTVKDQYTAPATVNSQGINLALTSSAGGTFAVTSVTVGGVALTAPFTVTGTFPNFAVAVPAGQVPQAVQLAGGAVQIVGTISGTQFSSNGNTLTTLAPIPFAATLTATYARQSVPYYMFSAAAVWAYSTTGTPSSYDGTITAGGVSTPATTATGSIPSILASGITIGGTATGTGSRGAGSSTVSLTGSTPALPDYIPAYYAQTASSTVPTFTTASTQTTGAASGSTITYPTATASTQYNWVAVPGSIPLSKLCIQLLFGCNPLTPNVTVAQTIAAFSFNVYGVTALGVGTAMQLVIQP